MYESTSQEQVSNQIIQKKAESITVGVTDSELAVLIRVDGFEAAYTADEARELADSLKHTSRQRWEVTATEAVNYIHDLADVVDGDKAADEVERPGASKELNP